MDMVADAANTDDMTARGVNQLANIAMHPLQMFVGYLWAQSLHVEDDVKINFAKRLWHVRKAFALSGRCFFVFSITQGGALGYELVGLSGRFSLQYNFSAHQFGK